MIHNGPAFPRFGRLRAIILGLTIGFAWSSVSVAQSVDLWTAAKFPGLAAQLAAVERAELHLEQADSIGEQSSAGRGFLRFAVTELRAVRAQDSIDVRPRFLLGRVLESLGEDEAALALLEPALAQAPEHPMAVEAHFAAAISCARLGKSEQELEHYEGVLRRETSLRKRVAAMTNQAEAFMLMGDVDRAVDVYRAALELIPDATLTHWGLAVSLDRSGDPHGGIEEARLALLSDPESRQLMSPGVFFIPAYDRYWYLALGAIAKARAADTKETRVQWWNWAVQMWTQYIDAALPADRWLPLARAHRETCQRELRKISPGGKLGPVAP